MGRVGTHWELVGVILWRCYLMDTLQNTGCSLPSLVPTREGYQE